MLRLDSNYTIESDGSGVVLNYSEERERTEKDGSIKKYTSTEKWYYPDVFLAIEKYASKVVEHSEDLKAVLASVTATTHLILSLKEEIKNLKTK